MRKIAVFARRPASGAVKTRLSPALPAGLACDLHRAMLADALSVAAAAAAEVRTLWWTGEARSAEPFEAPPGFAAMEQAGADLGERLERAFDDLLAAPGARAVAVGADCPDLDAGAIDEAFARLAASDLVLGPARDGGYVLIGLSRRAPALFRGIAWSTDRVLEQTLERARAEGLAVARLDPLEDLDTPRALVRWIARAAGAPGTRAPHTRAALAAMGLMPRV